jgi:O-antigen/teichoic acid export membrane protein
MAIISSFGKREFYFTLGRYIVYALQIAKGFALAYFLGPYFLGIYGYIMLYQQYLVYSNLGVQYALNAELSINTNSEQALKNSIENSAFSMTIFISLVLFALSLFIYFFKIEIFPYKHSYNYVFLLLLLACLGHFQEIFINIFRINKKLRPILYADFFIAILTVLVIPFFKGINLINAVLWTWVLSLSVAMLVYKNLYKKKIRFDSSYIKPLFNAGLPLLLFIFNYNLMGLTIRTLISIYYDTTSMGLFSFSNSLTSAIMLSFNSITWLMYPSIISKLSEYDLKGIELEEYLVGFSKKLIVIVFAIICIAIIVMPVLFIYLPKYEPIKGALIILLLNQVVFNAGFAFVSLAIGRKSYYQIAAISLLSVIVCFLFGIVFSIFKLPIVWLAIANILGSFLFLNVFMLFISRKYELSYAKILSVFDPILQLIILISCIAAVLGFQILVIGLILGALVIRRHDSVDLYYQVKKVLFSNQ